MFRQSVRALFIAITLFIIFAFLSGCATVRPYVSLTGDSYVMPHELRLAKRELHRQVQAEAAAGRWVELVVTVHCFTDTRIDFCVSMGEFFNSHLKPIGSTRIHWDLVPSPSLTRDSTYIVWDVVPLIHDQ
jgi:hypothetical protein